MEIKNWDQARLKRVVKQFAKFVIVGGINTGIDFFVLNALIFLTDIETGSGLFVLNSISFSVAVMNSYFMNKYWTFQDKTKTKQPTIKFSAFFVISIIGLLINGIVLASITTYIPPFFNLSTVIWANIAKLFATGFSLVWNFVGYKLFVFKK